jgi:phage-related protein
MGSSRHDLIGFPSDVRRHAGAQLRSVQTGDEVDDWKPFSDIGPGTFEIRLRDSSGIFRVMVVAKFEEAVYVLHCFQKKSQTTSGPDKVVARRRYADMLKLRKDL